MTKVSRRDVEGTVLEHAGCVCPTGKGDASSACENVTWIDTPNGPRAATEPCGPTRDDRAQAIRDHEAANDTVGLAQRDLAQRNLNAWRPKTLGTAPKVEHAQDINESALERARREMVERNFARGRR